MLFKKKLLAAVASILLIFGGVATTSVVAAPPAAAIETQVAANFLIYNGQIIGKLVVTSDGYSLASYMYHMNNARYKVVFTAVSLCYTQWPDGPCLPTYGWDGGNFGLWAGPAIPNPSGFYDARIGMMRSWKAGATMDWGGATRYIQIIGYESASNPGQWSICS